MLMYQRDFCFLHVRERHFLGNFACYVALSYLKTVLKPSVVDNRASRERTCTFAQFAT